MLLELLKVKREAIRQIGKDAAVIGQKLGIEPSWIVYEKNHTDPSSVKATPATEKQKHRVSR